MEVVIIGAGYAGLLAAVRLARRQHRQPVRLTLVNASDVFVERLRLHQFATNQSITPRPLSATLHGTGIDFVQGYVTGLDPARRMLAVRTDTGVRKIGYDQLLYALGSTIERASVPGVQEYAYTLTPTGPLSAAALRDRLPALNQTGGRVVICGAGATGIETAAEFASTYPQLRVHLITRGAIGRGLNSPITAYIRRSLQQLGVTLQDKTTVTEVGPNTVYTSAGSVAAGLCVWAGGFVAPPLARGAGLAVNERGQILIDPFMRSISHPDILVAGDAAYPVEEPGVPVRMSAVTATILGAHAADCLSATLHGRSPEPLSFAYLGQGIALGRHNAIGFNNYPDDQPRAPYFTGRLAYETREFFVRYLAASADLERRGLRFFWLGKGRYAAAQRRGSQRARIDSAL